METLIQSPEVTPQSEKNLRQARAVDEVIALEAKVKAVYEKTLTPLADRFAFRLGVTKNAPAGLPTVLLLGNHSSGKSSFINYVFGRDIQKTGVAPVDDGFTLIMHGDEETDLDGKSVVNHPKFPYQSLEQFGPTFLSHLKLKVRVSEVVRSLILIDSPGMIDSAKASRTRGYDFSAVVRHVAESADLIVFFFDPDKPGTTGESLAVFTEALSGVAHKLLIVMNKVDLFPNIRDFARAYGALCWNLAHVIKTKDMPHIFCTFIDTGAGPKSTHLPLGDFQQSRDEIIAEIARTPERRSDNLVNTLYDTARKLQMHARICANLSSEFSSIRLMTMALAVVITIAGALGTWYLFNTASAFEPRQLVPVLGGFAFAALVVWIRDWNANRHLANTLVRLDDVFRSEYQLELTLQNDKADLEALWESVKPGITEYVRQTDIKKIPKRMFNNSVFDKVDKAIVDEIPSLRRDVLKEA